MNERAKDLLDAALLLLCVFAAGWLAGTVVSAFLSQLLALAALPGRLALGVGVGALSLAAAAKYWAGGFIFHLLKRCGWRRAGLSAWGFFVVLNVVPAPDHLRSVWFYWSSAVGLAAAMYGARWAFENEFVPAVQGLRELLVSVFGG